MFKRVGDKIQLFSVVYFVLALIASVALAIVFGAVGGFRALPFFSFLIGGSLFAYISSLFIHGFGSIVWYHEPEESDKRENMVNVNWIDKQ